MEKIINIVERLTQGTKEVRQVPLYICRIGLVSGMPVLPGLMSEEALIKRVLQADKGNAIEWHIVEVPLDGTVSVRRILDAAFWRCQNIDGQRSPVGRSLDIGDVIGLHDGSGFRDYIVSPIGFIADRGRVLY